MLKRQVIKGTALSLSPIVHNEVLEYRSSVEKGAAKKQRTMPFVCKNENGFDQIYRVPVVSGNSLRGIGRRLLMDHSFDILGYTVSDILKSADARRVAYMFYSGGLTPAGVSPKAVSVGTYDQIRVAIPFFGLLAGVYMGHHFEGCCKVGILVPITKETYPLYSESIPDSIDKDRLVSVDSLLTTSAIRYTRRATEEKVEDGDKEAMIYGTETIPAGTHFWHYNTCVTDSEGAHLAFAAMFALLAQRGSVGGMTGRGHGQVSFSFQVEKDGQTTALDIRDSIERYDAFLVENSDTIKKSIAAIPEALKYDAGKKAASDE